MELQFLKKPYDCLRRVAWEIKNEEQTQEVKLMESMPDIGKVLGAWGQPVIRSKEWRGSSMGISGGVMAWVLYAPEDGTMPRSMEAWIPFQMRWDFPQTQRDGAMRISCLLRSIDARTVSARKLMLRSVISAVGEALEPTQVEIYQPGELPEDVQILRRSYPIRLPREAGEKTFLLDEELSLPASCAQVQKLVRYTLQPEMIDKKVMADKVVFRGAALIQGLCQCEDGTLKGFDFEVPFSQYAELEREYDPYATTDVIPAVTNLELEQGENGRLRLKAGMIGQYVIYDRPVFEVVEDAYSPSRSVVMQLQQLTLPAVLDTMQETLKAEQTMELEGEQIADIVFTAEHPFQRREELGIHMEIPGMFQVLAYDAEGNLQSGTARWDGTLELTAAGDTTLLASARISGKAQASTGGTMRCDAGVDMLATAETEIPMVTALELGELMEPDPGRPSLILRRVGADRLWDVAKQCGSTVEAIREANSLTEEPTNDQILLIPVS